MKKKWYKRGAILIQIPSRKSKIYFYNLTVVKSGEEFFITGYDGGW
jgi:hypothetical protein|tara:strand:- start:361 stop:498 length:138 start_codon:yes stop_codon:yes gene_type:complete